MSRRGIRVVSIAAAALVLAGCGGQAATVTGDHGTATATAVISTPGESAEAGLADEGAAGDATEEFLLASQVNLVSYGEGYLSCTEDLALLPDSYATEPSVWMTSGSGFGTPLVMWSYGLPYVKLCLNGFSPELPTTVVVEAGDFRSETSLTFVDEYSTDYGFLSPYTLFTDGGTLEVAFTADDPAWSSAFWSFLPPGEALEQFGSSPQFRVTAEQEGASASTDQVFNIPSEPDHRRVEPLPVGDVRLLVWGYPAGATIPIGLYTFAAGEEEPVPARLVEQVGTVTMPSYRIAEFVVPSGFLESRPFGLYVLQTPVEEGKNVAGAMVWPEYPGEVRLGDSGEAVVQWQEILMRAGYIKTSDANRDGDYGPLQFEKVVESQEDLRSRRPGLRDMSPDGVLDLEFYAALTGSLPPE